MSVALDILAFPLEAAPQVAPEPAPRRLRAVPDAAPQHAAPRSVVALRPPAGRDAVAPLRLTRRGVVVVALLVAALGGLLVWLAAASVPGSAAARPAPASVVVHPGDTVWNIASRYAGTRDPRSVVAQIDALNHLAGSAVTPGQILHLR